MAGSAKATRGAGRMLRDRPVKRLALPRRLHWVGPPVPTLPLPGREPARPRLSAESRPTDSHAPHQPPGLASLPEGSPTPDLAC